MAFPMTWVVGVSVLLLLIFRSVVVPVKSILMNLLSVWAAYGVITGVFQHGWGAAALGLQRTPRIEAWIPLFMFTILFGLSMDYHIFLLTRIRERYVVSAPLTGRASRIELHAGDAVAAGATTLCTIEPVDGPRRTSSSRSRNCLSAASRSSDA